MVAERFGYSPTTILPIGRATTGSSAQAKARRLGPVEQRWEREGAGNAAGALADDRLARTARSVPRGPNMTLGFRTRKRKWGRTGHRCDLGYSLRWPPRGGKRLETEKKG